MRRDEAENEPDTHACQCQRAVDAICTHHLRIVIVDPKERIEEQIFGRGGVLRDAVAEAVQGLQPVHLQFYTLEIGTACDHAAAEQCAEVQDVFNGPLLVSVGSSSLTHS
jgi:hypothetical protein